MRAPQYNRAAYMFSGMILLCQLPLLAIAGELSQTEHAIAASLAEATPWSLTLRSSVATQVATKSTAHPLGEHPLGEHPLGLQTLSIEADWKKHADGTRLARIYQYHHTQLKAVY